MGDPFPFDIAKGFDGDIGLTHKANFSYTPHTKKEDLIKF